MTQTSSRTGSSTGQTKEPPKEIPRIAMVLLQLRYQKVTALHPYTRFLFMITQGTPITSTNSMITEALVKPPSPPPGANNKPGVGHVVTDFFNSVEEEQAPIFIPVTGR